MPTSRETIASIPEPKLSRTLFADAGWITWLWLVARLYVGYEWVSAGWEKLTGTGWVGSQAGTAIGGFFQSALAQTTGAHPNVSSWYGFFIQNVAAAHPVFISYLVTYGELAVGIALILGVATGIAAFAGAFMNFNYLFAGAVSINPILLLIELFLILAWRNAGWLGIDRWLLPALGVPWQPGKLISRGERA
jgi:thiosulfate dehydrogenase (quinone) large subunit